MPDFSKLNPSQAQAAAHQGGAALVLAGPGSGKTFLIVNRIRYLIKHCQAAPDSILVITFTKAAALSMQKRFRESTGCEILPVNFGTFHAVFYQILKTYGSYDNQSLITTEEKYEYLEEILDQFLPVESESGETKTVGKNRKRERISSLLNLFSQYKNLEVQEEQLTPILPQGITYRQFRQIFAAFQTKMKAQKKLDFDDMAVLCLELLKENPCVRQKLHAQYRYILIDEYQDTNSVQDQVLRLLAAPENRIFAVGDDDQSIYGFRGSVPAIMSDFEKHYPGARIYRLEQNYRSTAPIVQAAARMISENQKRYSKEPVAEQAGGEPVRYLAFQEKHQEYAYLAQRIGELSGQVPYAEMAVIARTNRELEPIAEYLRISGIPCDCSDSRAGICGYFVYRDLLSCMDYVMGERLRPPEIWRELGGTETKKKLMAKQTPFGAIHFFRKGLAYDKYLLQKAGQDLEQLQEWQEILELFQEHSRQFLELRDWRRAIEESKKTGDKKRGTWQGTDLQPDQQRGVQLMTMHGSKGLEFTYVCIPNVNEGVIPGKQSRSQESIEEERRMLYVGMTRAKKVLDILYLTGTTEYPRLPSRFLNPLLKGDNRIYSSSSTSSSNSALSRNSSNASATASYSSSSSIKISSGSALGSLSSSL